MAHEGAVSIWKRTFGRHQTTAAVKAMGWLDSLREREE